MLNNQTLARMEPADQAALIPHLQEQEVTRGTLLVAQGDRVDYLYFPTTAFLANTVTFDNGQSVLPFVMGSEGVSSLAAFLAEEESFWAVEVRVGGGVYRVPAQAVRERMDKSRPLRRQLARLSHDYQAQAAYGLGCAVLHTVEKRLAGILLTTSERLGSDTLSFSQTDLGRVSGNATHHDQLRRPGTEAGRGVGLQTRPDRHHRPQGADAGRLRVLCGLSRTDGLRTRRRERIASGTHGAQHFAVALHVDHQPRTSHDRPPSGRQQLRQDLDRDGLGRFIIVEMLPVLVQEHGLGFNVKAVERHWLSTG